MVLRVGVLGGSGLYEMEGLTDVRRIKVNTPFGEPSDRYIIGSLGGVELVFLPRHGVGHRYNPSEVNYRANIWGMKYLGVKWIIAVSAVGSLREEVVPGDMVLIDSFIDRTYKRQNTFFEDGIVGHVQFGEPMCEELRAMLLKACQVNNLHELDEKASEEARVAKRKSIETQGGKCVHMGGTYVNMEGPAFSTVAESNMHRQFGARVIGMTNLAEARLAREAEIAFATVAMSTDYDCWRPGHDAVTVEDVVKCAMANVALVKKIIASVVPMIAEHGEPPAHITNALQGAVMTAPHCISPSNLDKVFWIKRLYNKTGGGCVHDAESSAAAHWTLAGFVAAAAAAAFFKR